MRTRNVRRTALVFTLALAGAAAWSAWRLSASGRRAGPAPSGELDGGELFERHCAKCHSADEFADRLRGPEPGAAARELVEFLGEHGEALEAEDRAIVEYLAERSR
jgi:mono/diheme cytochrome c family protein